MYLKDKLIQYTADETELPEELVESVISWVYKDTNKATALYSQIEISGFGKLLVSKSKLSKRINKFEGITKSVSNPKQLKGAEDILNFLISKNKNGIQQDTGGMEKPSISSTGD